MAGLATGTRVRLRCPSPRLSVPIPTGTVVAVEERDYLVCLVRLDKPARWLWPDGRRDDRDVTPEIWELAENLEVLA